MEAMENLIDGNKTMIEFEHVTEGCVQKGDYEIFPFSNRFVFSVVLATGVQIKFDSGEITLGRDCPTQVYVNGSSGKTFRWKRK